MIAEAALVFCLTTMIYYEARGESLKGKIAVAHVALNRQKSSEKDLCTILKEPYQFAVPKPSKRALQDPAWQEAYKVATLVINSCTIDPTKGATYFHAHYVNPTWAEKFSHTVTIGGHKFYKPQ